MIDDIFAPQEVDFTKHIPLVQCVLADFIFWPMSQDVQILMQVGLQVLEGRSSYGSPCGASAR